MDPWGLSSWGPVPGKPGWDKRHDNFPEPHDHYRKRGKEYRRKVYPDGKQERHPNGKKGKKMIDKDVPQDVIDAGKNGDNDNSSQCGEPWDLPEVPPLFIPIPIPPPGRPTLPRVGGGGSPRDRLPGIIPELASLNP